MEPRNYAANAEATPPAVPAAPSTGYPRAADPAAGKLATTPGPHWFYKVGESLRRVITDMGLVPDDGDLSLLSQAIQAYSQINIGFNQTWQDQTASRSSGVTYYNVTDKPIPVVISASGVNQADVTLTIDGVTISRQRPVTTSGDTLLASLFGIVPPGGSYGASIVNSSLQNWTELR